MSFTPISALIVDTLATFLNAFGLISMKVAHIESEKSGKNPYCTLRFLLQGVLLMIVANIVHLCMLPYGDMTLFTITSSFSILFSAYLSIKLLGEKFVCKYDMTATLLISIGCILTIAQINTQIDVVYTNETVKTKLTSYKSIVLFISTLIIFILSVISYKKLTVRTTKFLSDLDQWLLDMKQEAPIVSELLDLELKRHKELRQQAKATIDELLIRHQNAVVRSQQPNNKSESEQFSQSPDKEQSEQESKKQQNYSPNTKQRKTKDEKIGLSKRLAISYMRDVNKDILKEISPESKDLQSWLKVPMLLLVITCGALASACVALVKCSTELIKTEGSLSWTSFWLLFSGVVLGNVEFWVLNVTMSLYDQLEVQPTFQMGLVILNLIYGLVLLDESSMYTWWQLFFLFITSFIGLIGIQVLMVKKARTTLEVTAQELEITAVTQPFKKCNPNDSESQQDIAPILMLSDDQEQKQSSIKKQQPSDIETSSTDSKLHQKDNSE